MRHTQLLHLQKLADAIAVLLQSKKRRRTALFWLLAGETRFVRTNEVRERTVIRYFPFRKLHIKTPASVTRNFCIRKNLRMQSRLSCKAKSAEELRFFGFWQGRRDSNTQPMVLETTTLPLSHSPKLPIYFTMGQGDKSNVFLQIFKVVGVLPILFVLADDKARQLS